MKAIVMQWAESQCLGDIIGGNCVFVSLFLPGYVIILTGLKYVTTMLKYISVMLKYITMTSPAEYLLYV